MQTPPVDISAIIGERIKAARKLAENPKDFAAMSAMQKAQRNVGISNFEHCHFFCLVGGVSVSDHLS